MRTFRTRTTAVAATVLLAALSLTACQNDGTSGAAASSSAAAATPTPDRTAPGGATGGTAGKPVSGTPAAGGPGSAGGGPATGGSTGGTTDDGGAAPIATPTKGGPAAPAGDDPVTEPCGADAKVTYTAVSRPLNHALLTLTNTGSTPCNAYHAPLLRFDDAQAATAVDHGSRPQAVVTLAPGESAYASITLAAADGSGSEGGTARKVSVGFAPRSGEGSTGAAPAVVTLPTGTYTDSSATVTHWQSSMDDALMH
ncbi:DUF4232 domain-containing protein [Streptomyces lavendofoliae]|uniref:DUF4232 domain-containing protein n=1 Tax=Streptomyces lavendofoliae TaxID=67314 RepID=A0A918I4N3_9ACTN|nr:DUF4232 domain-containing protein [Streptomyces lavendofoliae]GGU60031.1 hypothetical protein GCM10010274_56090 [Streptomyces lavendofoliae]